MVIISGDDFYKKLKKSAVMEKAFLFFGDEDYMKLNVRKLMESTVCPDETFRDMNLFSFDSLNFSAETLADAFTAAPVFSEEKLVYVSGLDIDGMREAEFSQLISAIEGMAEYLGNVFVLDVRAENLTYEGRQEKTKRFRRLCELLSPVRFDKYTTARLVPWCVRHFEAEGIACEPEVAKSLIGHSGEDMFVLSGEIKKLCSYINAHKESAVSTDLVKRICCAYEDFGAFDLANALLARDIPMALRILKVKKEEKEEPVILLSQVSAVIYDLISIKLMISAGLSGEEIMSALNKKAYPVKLYSEASAKYEVSYLERALNGVLEVDAKCKSGFSGYGAIETFVCSL